MTLTWRGLIWYGRRYKALTWWPYLHPDERRAGITRTQIRRSINR